MILKKHLNMWAEVLYRYWKCWKKSITCSWSIFMEDLWKFFKSTTLLYLCRSSRSLCYWRMQESRWVWKIDATWRELVEKNNRVRWRSFKFSRFKVSFVCLSFFLTLFCYHPPNPPNLGWGIHVWESYYWWSRWISMSWRTNDRYHKGTWFDSCKPWSTSILNVKVYSY